jgi:hypothetical protein
MLPYSISSAASAMVFWVLWVLEHAPSPDANNTAKENCTSFSIFIIISAFLCKARKF